MSQLTIRRAGLLLIFCLVQSVAITNCSGTIIDYLSFPANDNNLALLATGTCSTEYNAIDLSPRISTQSFVQLIPDPGAQLTNSPTDECSVNNRVVYKNPIPFLNVDASDGKRSAVSFNTAFQFKLTTEADEYGGDGGMAFFIASTLNAPENTDGAYLGLANGTNTGNAFLALEFSTYKNDSLNDAYSDSHIGLDIGSIVRTNYTETSTYCINHVHHVPELNLHSNYTFTVWMSFEAPTQKIKVWMSRGNISFSSADPPSADQTNPEPIMITTITDPFDFLSNLFEPNMFVGFSATTKYSASSSFTPMGVSILKWYFSVDPASIDTPAKPTPYPFKIVLPVVLVGGVLLVGASIFSIEAQTVISGFGLISVCKLLWLSSATESSPSLIRAPVLQHRIMGLNSLLPFLYRVQG